MNYKTLIVIFISIFSFFTVHGTSETELDYAAGKRIFFAKCATCHSVNKELMGPMLGSISKKRSKEWLHYFIRNSQEVIVSGDEYANHLFEQYNHTVMPSFLELTDKDINQLLTYIESESLHPTDAFVAYPGIHQNVDPAVVGGKNLFDLHCSSCHFVNMEGYGPALGSVTKRRPKDWLFKFIKNSRDVINSGDEYSKFLYDQFEHKRMVPFDFMDDQSIESILTYIEYTSSSAPQIAGVNGFKYMDKDKEKGKLYSSYEYPLHSEGQGGGIFFKLFLSVVVTGAAIVHGYVLYRVYKYLSY